MGLIRNLYIPSKTYDDIYFQLKFQEFTWDRYDIYSRVFLYSFNMALVSLDNLVWLLSSWYEIRSPVRSVYIANTRIEFQDPKTFKSLSDMGTPRSARSRRELLSTRFNPGTRVPSHLQIKRFSVYIGNDRSRSIWFSKTINVDNYHKHKIRFPYYCYFLFISIWF